MAVTNTSNSFASTASSMSGSSASNSQSTATSSASSAYNTFLTLLTTQLKNQDPLNPTDTTQFTSEMIQLSGVEQQLNANNTLSAMLTDLSAISASNGLGYIGKNIVATGSTTAMQNGEATWDYNLASSANNVTLSVLDSNGNTVFQADGGKTTGQQSFVWNGQTSSGTSLSNGDYTLQVNAIDGSGKAITVSTEIAGTVTGVDTSNGTTKLKIGDVSVPVGNVTQLN